MAIHRAIVIALTLVLLPVFTTRAEELSENVMLVLDASGSMWGQVDGAPKIAIARDVVSGLLDGWDRSRHLGLIAYGHRRKGDCKDIETLAEVAPLNLERMKSLVKALSPRGKTPITASVRMAAEALRFREEKSTIILVSDGLETCKADPCALARELEAAGIDFTIHVVGFDLSKKDTATLRCLADETGGQYLSADNAGELQAALETVSAPPPPPEPVRYSFRATEEKNGPEIKQGLVWFLSPAGGGAPVIAGSPGGVVSAEIMPGSYIIEVLRPVDEASSEKEFRITSGADKTITLVLPAFAPPASVTGPADAPAGSLVEVIWDGPDDKNDYIALAKPGAKPGVYLRYAYTAKGSPVELRLPDEPGSYEFRYTHASGNKRTLADTQITATPVAATLDAGESIIAGKALEVAWTGPGYPNDYIAITRPKAKKGTYEAYTYVAKGTPLEVRVPEHPGVYEIRYVLSQSKNILARRPLIVEKATAELAAPGRAPLGSQIEITWEGPDNPKDYLTIVAPEAKQGTYGNYTYTNKGSPLEVQAPEKPGAYEIRYVAGQKKSILARRPLIVDDVEVSLIAPEGAALGSVIEVAWVGPNNKNDYITIVKPEAKQGSYGSYTYTREGNPLEIRLPEIIGEYEIRYVAGQKKSILARRELTVEKAGISMEVPEDAPAGSILELEWEGPNNPNDFITIVNSGAKAGKFGNYTRTNKGSPLDLRMPDEPGSYEIRYLSGSKKLTLLAVPVTVTPVSASLQSPASAPAGSVLEIAWAGPNNDRDFITIVRSSAKARTYGPYTKTAKGSPLELKLPDEPGSYELRYIMGQSKETLTARPLTIDEVSASLRAPSTAPPNEMVEVHWEGPNNGRDFITIVAKGAKEKKYGTYVRTQKGSPLEIRTPKEPGAYEIRYLTGQSYRSLARIPLIVE